MAIEAEDIAAISRVGIPRNILYVRLQQLLSSVLVYWDIHVEAQYIYHNECTKVQNLSVYNVRGRMLESARAIETQVGSVHCWKHHSTRVSCCMGSSAAQDMLAQL